MKRNTKKCSVCDKQISLSNFLKHEKSCKKNKHVFNRKECAYCNRSFATPSGRGLHERQCVKNPNKKPNGNIGKTSWAKGLNKEDPRIKKMAESVKKVMLEKKEKGELTFIEWSPEMKKAQSLRKKEFYKNNPEKHPNRILANNRNKMSYPEKVAYDFLVKTKVQFDHQKKIDQYFVDFFINGIIIEIDGEYWHPNGNAKDSIRDKILENLGFKVYRIKAKENIEQRLLSILNKH